MDTEKTTALEMEVQRVQRMHQRWIKMQLPPEMRMRLWELELELRRMHLESAR